MGKNVRYALYASFVIVGPWIFLLSSPQADQKGKEYTCTYSEIKPFVEISKDPRPALTKMGVSENLIDFYDDFLSGRSPSLCIVIKGAVTATKGTPQYDDAVNAILPAIYRQFEDYKDRIRVKVKIYPGGTIGDEPDFIRKLKLGQIQWAGGTANMGEMVLSDLSVFDLPFLFDYEPELYYNMKYCEVDWIFGKIAPTINRLLMENGFVLCGMLDGGGYASIATRTPLASAADFGQFTYFTPPQARIGGEINQALGFKKVVVSKIWDLPSITATGMIDSSPCCWYWHVLLQATPYHKYVTDYPLRGYIGAIVIAQKDMFDDLLHIANSPLSPFEDFAPEDALKIVRGMLLEMNKTIKEVMRMHIREKDASARRILLESGTYELTKFPTEEIEKVKQKILPLYTQLAEKDGTYSKWFLDEILKYREEYRQYKREGKLTDQWYDKGLYPDGYDEWGWTRRYGENFYVRQK